MKTTVLDHGYIEFIEHWGSDERIIEAARMSTGKGFYSWEAYKACQKCPAWMRLDGVDQHNDLCNHDWKEVPKGDVGLLAYLYANKHATPVEMAGMIIEVQAPIMVFREWHRHRTQSYNEMSARYTPLPNVNYMPTIERCLTVSGTNKQAGAIKESDVVTHESALAWLEELADLYEHAERVYQSGLKRGIPKEVARLSVPVGRYSRMRACANLRNWLAFLTLRMDEKAQWEIRQFANEVGKLIEQYYPRTWALFVGNRTIETQKATLN